MVVLISKQEIEEEEQARIGGRKLVIGSMPGNS